MKNYLFLLLFFISCSINSKNAVTNSRNLNVKYLLKDNRSLLWHGGGIDLLCFNKGRVEFYFTPQCMYSFKTKFENNKLEIIWDYNVDCVSDVKFKINNDDLSPKNGMIFAEVKLLDSTNLFIDYHYDEWIFNENLKYEYIDTLFPVSFVLDR